MNFPDCSLKLSKELRISSVEAIPEDKLSMLSRIPLMFSSFSASLSPLFNSFNPNCFVINPGEFGLKSA